MNSFGNARLLGTGQYLWEYGTGKFATGPLVIFVPHLDGATGYFESWLYGAMAYSGVRFQRGQRLCWSTPVRGHELYLVFTGLFHSENTGPWQISNTGLKIISVGDFNGAMDNFLSSGYGAIRFLGCLNQRGHSKSRHRSPLISRSRIPINIDRSLRELPAFNIDSIFQFTRNCHESFSFKGPVNIYGNTGLGNLQRDHPLFWYFSWTGPTVILRVGSVGPRLISV